MAFCSNCGQELEEGAKFCEGCGKAVKGTASNTERKTVYDGTIHKCPNCGEVIKSFVSICPSCGFELGGKTVSAALEKFITQINECDHLIDSTPQSKGEWNSWNKTKRFWWVVLNIFFICIPLVIYLVLPLVLINLTPKLSSEEKKMVSLIENFPFPNDRESTLAALIFAKEKVDFISKEKIDRKTAYWMRLWVAKAEQLKQKADMLFPNDNIVKQSYAEIATDGERVKKTIRIKAVCGIVILAAVIIFSIVRYGVLDRVGITDNTDYSATFEWQTNGLFSQIPQPETNNGHIVRESEDQINVDLYHISSADFESYVKACREAGFTVDVTKNDMVFYAHNDEGYDLSIFYDADKDVMSIYVDSYDLSEIETSTHTQTDIKNYTFNLPEYWVEEGSKNEYLQYYAEKGEKVVMLGISYPVDEDVDYDVSFDGLYADNDNMIKAITSWFTDGDVIDHEIFESNYGVKGILYRFTVKQKTGLLSNTDGNGYCFCFPSEEDRRWFYVVFLQTNNIEGNAYKDDYITLLSNIKKK